ncbi:hypothetical protein [Flammeovirga sp. SubArs3]|uniref:hypothetical protein n=1 Tax=Flammeovirga sp. SubArs3 TaxID=2995316 RepID=UPI00248D32B9|nr:hypothetical protein [Flammeovirga sp. SubArs3]
MGHYTSLLKHLDDHSIDYKVEENIKVSPYPYIHVNHQKIIIHLLFISEKNSQWHNDAESLIKFKDNFPNYQVIQLWSDVYFHNTAACLSRVNGALGISKTIYGRSITVEKIDKPTLDSFLKENHTNDPTNAKIKYGLFLKDQLVGVASFSGKRKMTKTNIGHESYELIRYCNKNGFTIMGGISKILKQFIIDYSPDDIMTYTDNDWSDGKSFAQLGFQLMQNIKSIPFIWNAEQNTRQFVSYNHNINNLNDNELLIYNSGSNKYVINFNSIND